VGGLPLYQNDDVIVPGIMKELGFSLRDARDYALIGCQEITGSGNDYAAGSGISPPSGYLHYSSYVFNMAINDGINPYNGERCPIHTGYLYDMKSIEEVKEAFASIARYVVRAQVSIDNYLEYIFMNNMIFPIVSISVDGCMESGKDISCGGARYNSYGGTAVGLATIADSITAIKYMCFDNKKCTTREIYDSVMPTGRDTSLFANHHKRGAAFRNANPYAYGNEVGNRYLLQCMQDCYSTRSKP
jgi:formate C-acetyltransferase